MKIRKGGPLEGLKILDLTRVLSGPFATSWLSDMGASVIKLEDPEGGDTSRGVDGFNNSFAVLNRNKRCVTLNLKTAKGKEIFLELVKQVDVVTENFRPGTLERNLKIVEILERIGLARGKSTAAVAVRFILDRLPGSVALCGVKRPEQLLPDALDWHLSPEELAQLDAASAYESSGHPELLRRI